MRVDNVGRNISSLLHLCGAKGESSFAIFDGMLCHRVRTNGLFDQHVRPYATVKYSTD